MSAIADLGVLVRENVTHAHEPQEGSVDVGFLHVVQFPLSKVTKEEFVQAIRDAEDGFYQKLTIEELKRGPSYIAIGAWIGDQTLALEFMGLGAILGLWKIVTPAVLGIEGEAAKQMMGMGFVMTSGMQVDA